MAIFYSDSTSTNNIIVTGSLIASGSIFVTSSLGSNLSLTGSLLGTASYAGATISASFITSSRVDGTSAYGYNTILAATYAVTCSYSDQSGIAYRSYQPLKLIYNSLGSTGSSLPTLYEGIANIGLPNVNTTLTINTSYLRLLPIYIPTSDYNINGVKWSQITAGAYTANNYNGVALYSYSGGTLTLQTSCSNDGNIWKATSGTIASKLFNTVYSPPSPGIYYVGMYFNWSAVTTNPVLGAHVATYPNAGFAAMDFTNSAKLYYASTGTGFQTTLLSSISSTTYTAVASVGTVYVALC